MSEIQNLIDDFQKITIDKEDVDTKVEETQEATQVKQEIQQQDTEQELIDKLDQLTITSDVKKEIPSKEEIPAPNEKEETEKQEQNQNTIIKGTMRSDGTYRKDIKIRAGYKNAEMVQRYVIPQKRK